MPDELARLSELFDAHCSADSTLDLDGFKAVVFALQADDSDVLGHHSPSIQHTDNHDHKHHSNSSPHHRHQHHAENQRLVYHDHHDRREHRRSGLTKRIELAAALAFVMFDLDHSGSVDKNEFLASMALFCQVDIVMAYIGMAYVVMAYVV